MNKETQIDIMEKQLSVFDNLMDKMAYLSTYFKPDPEFTQEARDEVMHNIMKEMK